MSSYVIEKQSRGVGAIGAIDLGAPARASGTIVTSRPQLRSAVKRPAQPRPNTRVPAKRPRANERVVSTRAPQTFRATRVFQPPQPPMIAPVVKYPVGPVGPGIQTAVDNSQAAVDRLVDADWEEAELEVPSGGIDRKWILIVGGLGVAGIAYLLLRKKR